MAERISVSGWMADAADPLPCAFYGDIPMLFSQRVCDCFTLFEKMSGRFQTHRCGPDRRTTWTCQGPSCWLRAIIIITLSVATGCTALHRHCTTYSEHPWTRYLPRFTMLSRTSSIMLRIYYPSSLAACASHNPGSKSMVGCVRTRSFIYLERNLNRFTSQDRESLGRRWIFFRIPCARRG
jgi:hypothetical protein